MDNPRAARVVEQHFLNLPGFHAGAYVRAYVEDTSARDVLPPEDKRSHPRFPNPRLVVEISDCFRRIELDFSISSSAERLNSFHKINTLISALVAFRDGMAEEAALRRSRDRAQRDAAADDLSRSTDPQSPMMHSTTSYDHGAYSR